MKLEDLEVYNLSMDVSDVIWDIVVKWDFFSKDTIGKQWVRAMDSVSANLSEGLGRNTFKDSRTFYYYARGSFSESKTWFEKSKRRNLIGDEQIQTISNIFEKLSIKLNNFIHAHEKLIEKTEYKK